MKKVSKKQTNKVPIPITYNKGIILPLIYVGDNGDILIKGNLSNKKFTDALKEFLIKIETYSSK